jgi:hypothetical protein
MIVIENAGIIEGDATSATEVDFSVYGLDNNALTFLANGQLASSKGTIFTANSTDVISVIILVNTGVAHNHVNLYIKPTGGTSRRLIPKDFQLEPGYSLHFEGGKVQIVSPTGVSGGGDPAYIMTFDNTSLVTGVLTVTHNFGHQYPGMPIVTDNNGKMIIPDEVTFTTANAFTVDLTSYGVISGTWRVVVLNSGASTAADAVSDTAYAASWDAVTTVAPSKNAVYDMMGGTTLAGSAANNINLVNGTASLDVAAGAAMNVDANLTVGSAITLPNVTAGGIPYGSAANVLADLAKGTANLKMFMNAGATAPEWAEGVKIITLTRDLTAATGSVAYTGVGFKPNSLICVYYLTGYGNGVGFAGPDLASACILTVAGVIGIGNTNFCQIYDSTGTKHQAATVASYGSDGFSLAWLKANDPTGTLNVFVLCKR